VGQRAVAAVNLARVERNCARLVRGGPRLCAVVKADGYGHGAVPCARAALAGGATALAVAAASEAAALRGAGIAAPVIVMGALTRQELEVALSVGADVVAWTEEFVSAVEATGQATVHVKLDTGMGRLGTRDVAAASRIVDRVADAAGLELGGLMTHFATADDLGDEFFDDQLGRFASWVADVRRTHLDVPAHAANSAALLRDVRSHFDMARCGVAIYGLDPYGGDPATRELEPALELRSWVAAVKPCSAGESAGYGRRYVAERDTVLGVLPIGYGDGVRRGLTNNAEVLVGGVRRRLVGTVSMDNVTVELGRGTDVRIGGLATLLGMDGDARITAEEMARWVGTINYEITCGISGRVPRVYHRDGVAQPA
jgi:alanine racemase